MKPRKCRYELSAADRLALRYVWFVHHPRVSSRVIGKEFGVSRQTLSYATTGKGLVKTPDLFAEPAPGGWYRILIDLYGRERKPDDEPNGSLVFYRAAQRAKEFEDRLTQEKNDNEVLQ